MQAARAECPGEEGEGGRPPAGREGPRDSPRVSSGQDVAEDGCVSCGR